MSPPLTSIFIHLYNETDLYLFAFISSLHFLSFLISLIPPLLCWNKSPAATTKASGAVVVLRPAPVPVSVTAPAADPDNVCSSRASDRDTPGLSRGAKKCVFANVATCEVDPSDNRGSDQSSEGPVPQPVAARFHINPS